MLRLSLPVAKRVILLEAESWQHPEVFPGGQQTCESEIRALKLQTHKRARTIPRGAAQTKCATAIASLFARIARAALRAARTRKATGWFSGITSASHAEGPGFNPQCVHTLVAPHARTGCVIHGHAPTASKPLCKFSAPAAFRRSACKRGVARLTVAEASRGFEPRSLDSESRVLTVTPRGRVLYARCRFHCGRRWI